MSKISQLQAATEVAANDLLEIVDVSDGTMSTTNGTNKKITVATLLSSSTAAGQRLLTRTSVPVGHIANLAEFTALEGNVAIEIQVSGYANGNSGTSTYRFQGGYNVGGPNGVLPTTTYHAGEEATAERFYRLYPFNDGRGHGEGTDTGLATTPWMLMIYHIRHVATTGGFGVAIVNSSSTVTRSFTVTITELRRGMTFTDKTADATSTFSVPIEANIYSHRNLLVQNRIGIGKVPTAALDVNGVITASSDSVINEIKVGKGNGTNGTNTIIGKDAFGAKNTTGTDNTAIGYYSLEANTSGIKNTAIGNFASMNITSGNNNTAIGSNALVAANTGSNNVAIGTYAASQVQESASNNICIGSNSGVDSLRSVTTGSNNIVLGNFNSETAHIKIAWTVVSDRRDKTSFASVPHGLEFVNALKPTAYRFKKNRDSEEPQEDSRVRYGFFAQDVLELEGEQPVVIDNSNPEHLAYNESSLIPILVNAIKELSAELQIVKTKLTSL